MFAVVLDERLFQKDGSEESTVLFMADGFQCPKTANAALQVRHSTTVAGLGRLTRDADKLDNTHESTATNTGALIDQIAAEYGAISFASLAKIRIGVVTGNSDFFVASGSNWRDRGVPERFLRPVLSSAKAFKGLTTGTTPPPFERQTLMLTVKSKLESAAVKRYLDSMVPGEIANNVTFAKRYPWFALDDGAVPDGFLGSLFHVGPRLILNELGINATNSVFRIYMAGQSLSRQRLIAVSFLSTYTQTAAELIGRPMSQGGLKLGVRDLEGLPLILPQVDDNLLLNVFDSTNRLLYAGCHDLARAEADVIVLAQLPEQMRDQLSSAYSVLRKRRIGI